MGRKGRRKIRSKNCYLARIWVKAVVKFKDVIVSPYLKQLAACTTTVPSLHLPSSGCSHIQGLHLHRPWCPSLRHFLTLRAFALLMHVRADKGIVTDLLVQSV